MKKFGIFILGLLSISLIGNFTHANTEYEYTNLDIVAKILEDGTINITEDFTANFFVYKHGIIRDIPLNYSVGGKDFHIEVSNIHVQGKNFTKSKSDGERNIKIGDANRTLKGEQNYLISYSTYGLIRNFSGMGYAELYWNLVGYNFDTNINKVRAEIILPKVYTGFTADDFLITTDGKSKTIDGFNGTVDWSQGDKIIITYNKRLPAYQGITISIKFPNNYFKFNHNRQAKLIGHSTSLGTKETKIFFFGLIIILVSFFSFTISIVKIIKYIIKKGKLRSKQRKIRKEYEKKYPVIVQYDAPKGLNSAEVGLLLNHYVKTQDLLTLIYKRASEKYIQIDNTGNAIIPDFSFKKLKELPKKCPEYEKNLFDDIFSDNDIFSKTTFVESNSLYYKLRSATVDLKNFGLDMGWFSKDIHTEVHSKIGCKNILIFIMGLPMLAIPVFTIILIILVGLSIGIEVKDLQETEKGAKLISHILGYKEFIRACDENKLRLFLKQDPTFFDKTLPYAIVFGLESELINKITPIMQEMNIKSSRYSGNIGEISSLTSSISSAGSYHSISSSDSSYSSDSGFDSGSSFSGGGSSFSSGGGGGGGGGRSW